MTSIWQMIKDLKISIQWIQLNNDVSDIFLTEKKLILITCNEEKCRIFYINSLKKFSLKKYRFSPSFREFFNFLLSNIAINMENMWPYLCLSFSLPTPSQPHDQNFFYFVYCALIWSKNGKTVFHRNYKSEITVMRMPMRVLSNEWLDAIF